MKKKPKKTNAVRLLDSHGIGCELREYDVDEHDLGGLYVAREIGLPPPQVFKTLLVSGDKTGFFFACVPVDAELDLKRLAAESNNKKVELVPVRDILGLTGYIRGGVSPIGAKKRFAVFMHESAFSFPFISLSAGVRGCQMLVDPSDLDSIVEIHRCDIARYEN